MSDKNDKEDDDNNTKDEDIDNEETDDSKKEQCDTSIIDDNPITSEKEKLEKELRYTKEALAISKIPDTKNHPNIHNSNCIPKNYERLFNMRKSELEKHKERLVKDIEDLDNFEDYSDIQSIDNKQNKDNKQTELNNKDREENNFDITNKTIEVIQTKDNINYIELHDNQGNKIKVFDNEKIDFNKRLEGNVKMFKVTDNNKNFLFSI